jgi:hypothetical protein
VVERKARQFDSEVKPEKGERQAARRIKVTAE